jgi:hypothetical protein
MSKNIKKWQICQHCLSSKAKTETGKMLFAGLGVLIQKYIIDKKKWCNPVRLLGQNRETEELCDNCEYSLEHKVIGQKNKDNRK